MSEIDTTVETLKNQINELQKQLADEKRTSENLRHELKAYNPSFQLMEKRALATLTSAGIDHPFTATKQTTILEAFDLLLAAHLNLKTDSRRAEQFQQLLKVMADEVYDAQKVSGLPADTGQSVGNMVVAMLRRLASECHELREQQRIDGAQRAENQKLQDQLREKDSRISELDERAKRLTSELDFEREGYGKLSAVIFGDETHTLDECLDVIRPMRNGTDNVYRAYVSLIGHNLDDKINHLFNLANGLRSSVGSLKSTL